MASILIVEEDASLAEGLRLALELEGHRVAVAASGTAGLEGARRDAPDLLILELALPELDGLRVLKTLREEGDQVPVLILTARGEVADRVTGFRLGADDYVTKPFSLLELLARVGAVLRRSCPCRRPAPERGVHRFGDVEVDGRRRVVTRGSGEVLLTPREFDLLLELLARGGEVVSRDTLLREVWGHKGRARTRTIDMHVAELRRKLEKDSARPRHIVTVRKVGYRLQA